MRIIRQSGTEERDVYTVNVKERDSGQDIGCIQISTRTRTTEKEALSPATRGNPHHVISDTRPSLDHFLCNSCGEYVHRRGFTPDKRNRDGIDYVCKSCRAEQRQRQRRTEKERHY